MADFKMPEAQLGDFVLYYPHVNAEASLAQVIRTGTRALTLWVMTPGYGGVEKTSVHHKDDPGITDNAEWARYGQWEPRPRDPKIAILAEKVALIEKKLEAIDPSRGNRK